jgi:arylamine N-acetyltransferase
MLQLQLVEQILQKMGFGTTPDNDLAGLTAIYGRWCRQIPFDNIQKRIFYSGSAQGPVPGHSSEDFFQKWLAHGTGGTCWANSHAVHDLLGALGFDVVRVAATMLSTPDVAGPTHGTVFARIDGQRYLVDGSMQTELPVPVQEGGPQEIRHPAERVHWEHRDWHWYVRWHPAHRPDGLWCRIEMVEVPQAQFNEFHERTRTRSPFNSSLYVRLNYPDHTATIASGERLIMKLDGNPVSVPLTEDQRIRILVEEFGISEELAASLPADQPWPPGLETFQLPRRRGNCV